MRIPCRTGAVHRPRRPIIGSPDAQPAATPDSAVGDGTPFLRLPRHPRPLPVSGSRPPQPRRRHRRHDGLDRPCRSGAAPHRGARRSVSSGSGAASPRPGCSAAIAAFALLIAVSAIPNGASALTAAGKLSELRDPRARRRRVRRHARGGSAARLLPRRLLHRRRRLGRGRVRRQRRRAAGIVHGRARPRRSLDDGARVSGWRTSSHRDRRPPPLALVGIVVGALGIVLGASLASVLGLYIAAVAMIALALGRRDLRRRAVVVTRPDLRRRHRRDVRPAQRRPRLPAVVVRATAGDAGPVRRRAGATG